MVPLLFIACTAVLIDALVHRFTGWHIALMLLQLVLAFAGSWWAVGLWSAVTVFATVARLPRRPS